MIEVEEEFAPTSRPTLRYTEPELAEQTQVPRKVREATLSPERGARTHERRSRDRYGVGMSAAAQTSDHGAGISRVSSFDQYRSLRTNEPSSAHPQSVGPLFRSEHQFLQSNPQHTELTNDRNTEPVAATVRDQSRSAPVGWMAAITEKLDALWQAFHRSQGTTTENANADESNDNAGTRPPPPSPVTGHEGRVSRQSSHRANEQFRNRNDSRALRNCQYGERDRLRDTQRQQLSSIESSRYHSKKDSDRSKHNQDLASRDYDRRRVGPDQSGSGDHSSSDEESEKDRGRRRGRRRSRSRYRQSKRRRNASPDGDGSGSSFMALG